MSPVVLILTHPDDVHADAVQAHLDAAGVAVCRVDTAALGSPGAPVAVHLGGAAVTGRVAGVELDRIVGVWHRRPSEFVADDPDDLAELRAGVAGVLAALPYLNHPAAMAAAGFKPYQLVMAVRCGLRVPETVVSTARSDGADLAVRHQGRVVVKPMSRQVAGLVSADDRSGWDRAAHMTQQRITPAWHARLTVVDAGMYAARIDSPYLDWRRDLGRCTYQPVTTPAEVAGPVRELLARLRLRFAALDFAIDADGCWWFLELNADGQFLWIEQATDMLISAAIASALRSPDPLWADLVGHPQPTDSPQLWGYLVPGIG